MSFIYKIIEPVNSTPTEGEKKTKKNKVMLLPEETGAF